MIEIQCFKASCCSVISLLSFAKRKSKEYKKFFTKIRIVYFIFILPFRCLRYASTGNFPPGSYMGRNFVHDPKMNKASVVNAHLKMSFISNDNRRHIISRSVQAKQGPKQVQIKTLDSTLRYL